MAAEAQLRANVRLLGDVLGAVLVEQEGEELLALEERIRGHAREARAAGDRSELERAIAASTSSSRHSAAAFSLFFQLANIAEQHHRSAGGGSTSARDGSPRESLADAVTQLREAGVGRRRAARRGFAARVEPVLTAHPTEATRRTILRRTSGIATALRALDDPG